MPSWSWMAYKGGIQFIDVPFGKVEWFDQLQFDTVSDHAIITNLWTFQNCTVEVYKTWYAVLDSDGARRGRIHYDTEGIKDPCEDHCIVIGKESNNGVYDYYVLIVRSTNVDRTYERIGVGLIQSDYLVGHKITVRVS